MSSRGDPDRSNRGRRGNSGRISRGRGGRTNNNNNNSNNNLGNASIRMGGPGRGHGRKSNRAAGLYKGQQQRQVKYSASTAPGVPYQPQKKKKSLSDPPNHLTENLRENAITQPTLHGMDKGDDENNSSQSTIDTAHPPTSTFKPFVLPNYAFDPEKNEEASTTDKTIADTYTDLEKATETLKPLEQMRTRVTHFKNTMNGATINFEKCKTSYAMTDGPNFVYKAARTHVKLEIEYGTNQYPTTLEPMFKTCAARVDELNSKFQKDQTEVMHEAHRLAVFKRRLDRANILHTHLVHQLGRFHAAYYRTKHNLRQPNTTAEDEQKLCVKLAITADLALLNKLDLDMLKYLDMNRDTLIDNFISAYSPSNYNNLEQHEKDTVDYICNTILSYIKPATCLHSSKKQEQQLETRAEAIVAAEMESDTARQAHAAVDKALRQQDMPKDNKSFHNAVVGIIHSVQNKHVQSHQKRKAAALNSKNNTNKDNKKARTNNPKARAAGKTPPAASTKGNNNNNSNKQKNNQAHGKHNKKKAPHKQR